jgi:hypothetical protein
VREESELKMKIYSANNKVKVPKIGTMFKVTKITKYNGCWTIELTEMGVGE